MREKIGFALIGAGLIGPSHAESITMVVGAEPAITGRSARKPLELILAMYESSKTGKEITL